jgi:hypothetical protein
MPFFFDAAEKAVSGRNNLCKPTRPANIQGHFRSLSLSQSLRVGRCIEVLLYFKQHAIIFDGALNSAANTL